jgi:hypothetical protein
LRKTPDAFAGATPFIRDPYRAGPKVENWKMELRLKRCVRAATFFYFRVSIHGE